MRYIKVFSIILAAGTSVLNAADAPRLECRTDPSVGFIKPNVNTAALSMRAEDAAGQVVPAPTRFHIELDSPPRNAFFSTGFPIVEGTPLLRGDFHSDNGQIALRYLFPIRGEYRLKVVAESVLGRSEREWNLRIQEEPRVVGRFSVLMTLLGVFGLLSGICLARAARWRALAGSTAASGMVALVLLAGAPSNGMAEEVHAPAHANAEVKTTDRAIAESASGRLALQLLPPVATVGDLATLKGMFEPKGLTNGPIEFTLSFVNLDHNHEVFRTRFMAPDGAFALRYQFTDGASHRVAVSARPAADTNGFAEATMNVAVRAIQPPAPVVARTLLFLLGTTAFAMGLGFVGALRFSKA